MSGWKGSLFSLMHVLLNTHIIARVHKHTTHYAVDCDWDANANANAPNKSSVKTMLDVANTIRACETQM